MKSLSPEQQLQLQLDVDHLKTQIEDLKSQLVGLSLSMSQALEANQKGLLAVNDTVKAHHELLTLVVDKIRLQVIT